MAASRLLQPPTLQVVDGFRLPEQGHRHDSVVRMPGSNRPPLDVVGQLARALDADDFDTLRSLLHPDVLYRIGTQVHRGQDAVIKSYSAGSALARELFDHVVFDHTVLGLVGDRTVRVDFSDRLEAAGAVFDHHSVQDVEVDDDGSVVVIVDQPVVGQRERLDAFMEKHGLTRPSAEPPAT